MKLVLAILLIVISVLILTGCINSQIPPTSTFKSPSSAINSVGSPVSETNAQDIVANVVSAMSRVKTYQLDANLVESYNSSSTGISSTEEWNGTKVIDIPNNNLKMEMTISLDKIIISPSAEGKDESSFELYLMDGSEYFKAHPGLSHSWIKSQPSNGLWASEIQIPYYLELLSNSSQYSLVGENNFSGEACYILTIIPSTQSMIDWILSQRQPTGPQIGIAQGGVTPLERPDAYQGGSIKLWIEKDNFLILKAEINADFYGPVGGGPIYIYTSPYTPSGPPVKSDYNGQFTFRAYNQPVSIQLPSDALNAQEQ